MGTRDCRRAFTDIKLDDVLACPPPGVVDGGAHVDRAGRGKVTVIDVEAVKIEGGVGESVSEWETGRNLASVVPAVAGENAFGKTHGAITGGGEVEKARGVLDPDRKRFGETPGRVDRTGEDVGDGATGGLTAKPDFKQGRDAVEPRARRRRTR